MAWSPGAKKAGQEREAWRVCVQGPVPSLGGSASHLICPVWGGAVPCPGVLGFGSTCTRSRCPGNCRREGLGRMECPFCRLQNKGTVLKEGVRSTVLPPALQRAPWRLTVATKTEGTAQAPWREVGQHAQGREPGQGRLSLSILCGSPVGFRELGDSPTEMLLLPPEAADRRGRLAASSPPAPGALSPWISRCRANSKQSPGSSRHAGGPEVVRWPVELN